MKRIGKWLGRYSLVLVLVGLLSTLIVSYARDPATPVPTETALALLGAVVAAFNRAIGPKTIRQARTAVRSLLVTRRKIQQLSRDLARAHRDLDVLRSDLERERAAHNAAVQRLEMLSEIDRVERVIVELEMIVAALGEAIPVPRRRPHDSG